MDTARLEKIRDLLGAAVLSLVQPVVRGDTLYIGQHLHLSEQGAPTRSSCQGRPLHDCVQVGSREELVERFHLDGGGAVGVSADGTPYKAGEGLQPIPSDHLLALFPDPTPAIPCYGAWLVLDGQALGLVLAAGERITSSRRREAMPDLKALRRQLARQFDEMRLHLQRTGLVVLDEANTVLAADPQGEAFTRAQRGRPPEPGVSRGVMVAAQSVAGSQGGTVTTVRPVRMPAAPIGLLLTPAQRQILPHLTTSATLAEIATARGSSRPTVERHRDNIYTALGTSRRVEIAERLRGL